MDEHIKHYADKLRCEIDCWDLNESILNNDDIVVIDARSLSDYKEEHIFSAISLPHREMTEESTKSFDRNSLYATYCDGIGCNASTKGALNMSKLGFKVKELMGGIEWWKRDGHKTEGENSEDSDESDCGCS